MIHNRGMIKQRLHTWLYDSRKWVKWAVGLTIGAIAYGLVIGLVWSIFGGR